MPLEVTRMKHDDIDGAIDTIQQAFAGDPYNNWVFDHSRFSPTRNRASLRTRCVWGITHGLFLVARDPSSPTPSKILGTAMWLPPQPSATTTATWSAYLASWSLYLSIWTLWLSQIKMNLLYGRGGLNVRRYYIWKAAQAAAQAELWTDPGGYYFCNIVTVLPEAQGKGVGRALMEEVLRMADEEGRSCYLESSRKDPNVKIYERFGFRLVKEMECVDEGEGITLYCMVREPKRGKEAEETEVGKAAVGDVVGEMRVDG